MMGWRFLLTGPGDPFDRTGVVTVGATSFVVHSVIRHAGVRQGSQCFLSSFWENGVNQQFTHVPYEHDAFVWLVTWINRLPEPPHVTVLVGQDELPVALDQLRKVSTLEAMGPVWCLVATMGETRKYGPGGQETRRGSRHFAPGAKLYVIGVMGWDDDPQIEVIGHHRGSHRYARMIVSASWLTNWRVELAYSPHVIEQLWPKWDGTPEAKTRAEEFAERIATFGNE